MLIPCKFIVRRINLFFNYQLHIFDMIFTSMKYDMICVDNTHIEVENSP